MCTLSIKPTLITVKTVIVKDTFSSKWSVAFTILQQLIQILKILIMGHFLLTLRISMSHSLTFFVNISDFNGTFLDGM
jgi:hypothetical protein